MLRSSDEKVTRRYPNYTEMVAVKDAVERKDTSPDSPTAWALRRRVWESSNIDIAEATVREILNRGFIAKRVQRREDLVRYVSHAAVAKARSPLRKPKRTSIQTAT